MAAKACVSLVQCKLLCAWKRVGVVDGSGGQARAPFSCLGSASELGTALNWGPPDEGFAWMSGAGWELGDGWVGMGRAGGRGWGGGEAAVSKQATEPGASGF